MSGLSSEDEQTPSKTCLDCGETKPLENFSPSPRGVNRRNSYCKICMRERSKASYRKRRAAAGRTVREARVVPVGMKWCPDCETARTLAEFPKNRADRTGYATYCKPCHNARTRANIQKNHGNTRNYHLRGRYGLDAADYQRMLDEQGGLCAGCKKVEPNHVDHDHETGEVRGLLCSSCNQALGNLRDDLQVMDSLAAYLARARTGYAPLRAYLPPPSVAIEWVPAFLHARSS
jgi:hypothetical protein